jgi:hypothetical protein
VTDPATVRHPADITPAWLTAALGTTITDVRNERVGTGQMAACYRLHLTGDDCPTTLVAKLPPPDVDLGPTAAGAYRNEVAFYAELAPTVAVRAPVCHHHALGDGGSSFTLLLEDMAPARQGDQVAGCSADRALDAVVALAGLHGPRWCDPTLAEVSTFVLPAPGDGDVLAGILATATGTFCDRYADRLAPADRQVLEAVPGLIAAWSTARTERFAPVHGDFRLDNLLFPDEGGDVGVVDWQTVSLGLPARDLAYFLGTCLSVDDRRAHEDDLVAAYHAALVDHGVAGYRLGDCRDDYRFGLLQGPLIAVLGAAFSQRTDRGDDMFMAMVARSCAAIRDHGALGMVRN